MAGCAVVAHSVVAPWSASRLYGRPRPRVPLSLLFSSSRDHHRITNRSAGRGTWVPPSGNSDLTINRASELYSGAPSGPEESSRGQATRGLPLASSELLVGATSPPPARSTLWPTTPQHSTTVISTFILLAMPFSMFSAGQFWTWGSGWPDCMLAGELLAAGAEIHRLGALRLGRRTWIIDPTNDGSDQPMHTFSVGHTLLVDRRSDGCYAINLI